MSNIVLPEKEISDALFLPCIEKLTSNRLQKSIYLNFYDSILSLKLADEFSTDHEDFNPPDTDPDNSDANSSNNGDDDEGMLLADLGSKNVPKTSGERKKLYFSDSIEVFQS